MKAAKWREFIFGAAIEITAKIVKIANRKGYCISCQAFDLAFEKAKFILELCQVLVQRTFQ